MAKTELERVCDFIKKVGPDELSQRVKVSRRTLYYMISSKGYVPNYRTMQKLLAEAAR